MTTGEGRNVDWSMNWQLHCHTTEDWYSIPITKEAAQIYLLHSLSTPPLEASTCSRPRVDTPPAKNRGLRIGGAKSCSWHFMLSYKLEVMVWWSQENHIICEKQSQNPETRKPPPSARPRNSPLNYYEKNLWQRGERWTWAPTGNESDLLLAMQTEL